MWEHSLNPDNVSEGGNPLVSKYGQAMHHFRFNGPLTVLPHENLMYPGRFGITVATHTTRPSVPYIRDQFMGGPVRLGPNEVPTKVR